MRIYEKKRHFEKTPEPTFESEDTVLLSFALPKAKMPEVREQLLAVETEFHPLKYLHFVGPIPGGEYGAGKVSIFDSGEYTVVDADSKRMIVEMTGEKVKGKFALIHTGHDKYLITKVE